MGWEVKNDMRGEAKHGPRVSNIKIRNYLPGVAQANFLELWVMVCEIKVIVIIFLKIVNLDEK